MSEGTFEYVIRYDSGNLTNGVPVGTVYVVAVTDVIPGYPGHDAYTYTKRLDEASRFTYEQAVKQVARRSWRNAVVLRVEEAPINLEGGAT